ncbi:uncharacterized protein LOC121054417 [Oryza brachyantha]|uniref:uncharacterized protein LOC121054417 n=1 Tax=Oryza brachyantha TaxID=4533 RepID=UPI001ADA8C18|nr:uncharacterized protein LOC121054417 [Oryza brachyantha]
MSEEIHNVGRAPMFNGTNYSTWKIKMSTYLKAMNASIWKVVDEGCVMPLDSTTPTQLELRNASYNAQAMNALFNSLSQEEFDRISNLETAYEIWVKLSEIHEGTSEYKDAKLHFLKVQYETFTMLPHKSVNDMYVRLNVIVNDLKGLGAAYTDLEIAQKMLRALPEKYETLVTVLINSDMSRMTPASLLGKINTNDMYKLKKKEMEEASPSKKCIALQAEVEDKGKSKANEAHDDLEGENALLARRFNDFLGRRKEKGRGSNSNRGRNRKPNKTLSNLRCFECGEKGHFASKCPSKDEDGDKSYKKKSGGYKLMKKLKKEGRKIEAFIGQWDSNEESTTSSGSDEEEVDDDASSKKRKMAMVAIKEAPSLFAPLCLMAKNSSKVSSFSHSESDDDCDDVFYDELMSMFEELHAYSEKEIVKFKALKKDHASLKVLYEELKTSHEKLTISHEKFKEAHDNLLSTTQHGALIDVGISCDLLDDSTTCHIAHVASSSISTSCDDLMDVPSSSSSSSSCVSTHDTSLVIENNELKEQVAKLNKKLGFIPKKGKKLSHHVTRFVKSNGKYCTKCHEVRHLVNNCYGDKPPKPYLFDSHYMLRKTYDGRIVAKYVGSLYLVMNYRTGGSHWVLDRGCTQHMTGDRAMITTFEVGGKEKKKVTFRDNSKGNVIGLGKIAISNDLSIQNVSLVESLNFNLLSVTQICDLGLSCNFFPHEVVVSSLYDKSCVFKGLDMEIFTWRLAHVGMNQLSKLSKRDLVVGLKDVKFEKDKLCSACQAGKQVFFLHDKSIVADLFKKFAKMAQNEFNCSLVKIRSDNGSEFKNTNIEDYCDDLGYVSNSKAYRVYNKSKDIVEETADVQFDETNGSQEGHDNLDDVDDEGLMKAMKNMFIGDIKPNEDFKIGKVDTTLFIKIIDDDFFVCQIYVDDIIFGSTNEVYCKEFGDMMSREFEMSMIGELSFFLGLQIKQLKEGTFVSQTKYIKDLLKRFGLEDAKPIKTPMATNGHLDLDEGEMPPRTHRQLTQDPTSESDGESDNCSAEQYPQSDEEAEENVEEGSEEESEEDGSGNEENKVDESDEIEIDPSIQFVKTVYEQIYVGKAFADHKWISWRDINETPEFQSLHDLFKLVGIDRIVTLKQDYNEDLIRQFYATFWSLLNIRFDFGDDLHEELNFNPLSMDYLSQFYEDGVQYTHGKVAGLSTIPSVVNRIVRATILPRLGNNDDIRGVAWYVIDAIIQGRQFDVVTLMMQEIAISKSTFT